MATVDFDDTKDDRRPADAMDDDDDLEAWRIRAQASEEEVTILRRDAPRPRAAPGGSGVSDRPSAILLAVADSIVVGSRTSDPAEREGAPIPVRRPSAADRSSPPGSNGRNVGVT